MVGKAMAIDLSAKYKVKSIDIDKKSLDFLSNNYKIETEIIDVTPIAHNGCRPPKRRRV